MHVCAFVGLCDGVGGTRVVFRISFLFSLVLFQENQERNGSVSETNVEKQGISFICLAIFSFVIKPLLGFI